MKKSKTEYFEKFLPVQAKFSNLYCGGKQKLFEDMYDTVIDVCNIKHPLKQFKLTTSKLIPMEEMGSNPLMLRMLEFLVLLKKPKKILEIGSYIGLSAMSMAKTLPKGGKIVTIEKFDKIAEIARKNFKKNGFSKTIRLIEGDAFEKKAEIRKLGKYDMIFIDGNKERYDEYFLLADKILNPGGLIIIDDSFFHGDAINKKPKTDKGRGVRKALMKVRAAKNYFKILLPLSNGYTVVVKKG